MLDTLRTPATYGWKKWYFCAIPSHVIWPWRSDMESFYRSLCWYINNTKSALTWEIAITLYSTLSLLFLSANHTLGNLHPNSHGPWKGKHSTGQARIKDPDQTAAKIGAVSSPKVEGSWFPGGQRPWAWQQQWVHQCNPGSWSSPRVFHYLLCVHGLGLDQWFLWNCAVHTTW